MHTQNAQGLLWLIQGYAEGRTVKCRRKNMKFAPWDEVDIVFDGQFDLQHYEYRIKPDESAIQNKTKEQSLNQKQL